MYVKALAMIASRYAPSRILSFDSVHVFKVLHLIESKGHVSRNILCASLLQHLSLNTVFFRAL